MLVYLISFLLSAVTPSSFLQSDVHYGEFKSIYSDNFGVLYCIGQKDGVIKLGEKMDTSFTFENQSFAVSHIDVSNPLKILVYNNYQNIVQYLDRTLSDMSGVIRLDDVNISSVNSVAASRDNTFWVFDQNNQELKKLTVSGVEVDSSGSMLSIAGKNIDPCFLKESNSRVYLVDSVQGVFQFDHLGSFLFHFKTIQTKKIVVKGDQIMFLTGGKVRVLNTILLEQNVLELPVQENILDFAVSKNSIFVLLEDRILKFVLSKNN